MHIVPVSGLGKVVPFYLQPVYLSCLMALRDCLLRMHLLAESVSGHSLRYAEFIFIGSVMKSFASSLSLCAKQFITLCAITVVLLGQIY